MKYPKVAQRFIEIMNEKNLKAIELSEKTGVPKGTISRYVHGINAPTNLIAGRIGEVLGVTPMWLMGFDGAPKYPSNEIEKHMKDKKNYSQEYIDAFYERMKVYCSLLTENQKSALDEYVRDMIRNQKNV